MPVPQAVIFDLGKVLLDFDYGIAIRRLLPRCQADLDALQRTLTQDQLLIDYETGLLTSEAFFARLRDAIRYDGTFGEFRAVFGDIFAPIEPMIALQQGLSAQGVPTYLFSNTNEMAIDFVRAQFPFVGSFNGKVLSYEVRSMKPAPPMYEEAERLSGFRGPDVFYLDDRPENVEAGLARGWQGWVHRDPAETVAVLARAGLQVKAP